MNDESRLRAKLQEQLQYIDASCQLFDRGVEAEGIRIATSLRVIFHNNKGNVSLVEHLGLARQNVFSSARGYGNWQDYLAEKLDLTSPRPVRMAPLLGNTFRCLSVEDWWAKESVFVYDDEPYSRGLIVRSAADRDGGAHVDRNLDEYYKVLCAGEYAFGITGDLTYKGNPPFPQGITLYPTNAHLALLRQFGHEVLTSVRHFGWL